MSETAQATALAIKFHEVYERLAPDFGYATREETRQFDTTTPNGRLMIAVCKELLSGDVIKPGLSFPPSPAPLFSEFGIRMANVVASELGLGKFHNLKPDTTFDELGADSIDMIELAMAIEDEFNVEIPDVFLADVQTIAQLITYVEEQRKTPA